MSLQDIIKCTDLLAEKDAIIAELQDELSDYWWYALQKESVEKSDGWLCPYMGDGEYAGPKLVEIGQAEKHPDKDWYRVIKQQQPQQEQDDVELEQDDE